MGKQYHTAFYSVPKPNSGSSSWSEALREVNEWLESNLNVDVEQIFVGPNNDQVGLLLVYTISTEPTEGRPATRVAAYWIFGDEKDNPIANLPNIRLLASQQISVLKCRNGQGYTTAFVCYVDEDSVEEMRDKIIK